MKKILFFADFQARFYTCSGDQNYLIFLFSYFWKYRDDFLCPYERRNMKTNCIGA